MDSEYQILESLNDEDIIDFNSDIIKVKLLKAAFKDNLTEDNIYNTTSSIILNMLRSSLDVKKEDIPDQNLNIINGIDCKILKANEDWKNGEIKIITLNINVEFCPIGVVKDSRYKYLESLNDDIVIEFAPHIFRVKNFKQNLKNSIEISLVTNISSMIQHNLNHLNQSIQKRIGKHMPLYSNNWMKDGIECKLLQVNKDWIPGKIKVTLDINVEFFPKDLYAGLSKIKNEFI